MQKQCEKKQGARLENTVSNVVKNILIGAWSECITSFVLVHFVQATLQALYEVRYTYCTPNLQKFYAINKPQYFRKIWANKRKFQCKAWWYDVTILGLSTSSIMQICESW